ncbi:MAG: GHKL domain-containing protein, partial [Lachnospiraceae bacterium]
SIKGEGHGFGLYRIDKIIKERHGYLNRKDEPGVFSTEIMLPFVL